MDKDERVLQQIERGLIRLHCVFRFEIELLLARTGFVNAVVYGDFTREMLQDSSPHMVWVAQVN